MKAKRHKYIVALSVLAGMALSGCMGDNTVDYTGWRDDNNTFVTEAIAALDENGQPEYTKVTPVWEPSVFLLMKWHNDRSKTMMNLIPLDNSTVNVKYEMELIDGSFSENSYSSTTYGDSIYQTKPCSNITGFWAGLRQMHVGDSVTMIIPWQAGYGSMTVGSIKPYSTLIYRVKLKSIKAFEVPN